MTTLAIDPTADLLRWRSDREDVLRAPHGWLSLVGLHALTATPRPVPGVPGLWWTDGTDALVRTDAADGVTDPARGCRRSWPRSCRRDVPTRTAWSWS